MTIFLKFDANVHTDSKIICLEFGDLRSKVKVAVTSEKQFEHNSRKVTQFNLNVFIDRMRHDMFITT